MIVKRMTNYVGNIMVKKIKSYSGRQQLFFSALYFILTNKTNCSLYSNITRCNCHSLDWSQYENHIYCLFTEKRTMDSEKENKLSLLLIT